MNGWANCKENPCPPPVPPGWDEFYASGGGEFYYDYNIWHNGRKTHYGNAEGDYSTDVFGDLATYLIRSAPAGVPVFAWITPNAPHGPTIPARRHKGAPCLAGVWTPHSWNELDVSDKPAYVRSQSLLGRPDNLRKICRTLLSVDELIADVRQALIDTDRWRDTIFIYMGDNDLSMGEHRLRGKTAPYATRVPAIFHGPWSPRTVSDRVYNKDFGATICELAGCDLQGDGASLVPLLTGQEEKLGRTSWIEELLVDHNGVPAWSAVVTDGFIGAPGEWHYIEYGTGERELYDLTNGPCWAWKIGDPGDPCELDNLAGKPQYALIQAALAAELARLRP